MVDVDVVDVLVGLLVKFLIGFLFGFKVIKLIQGVFLEVAIVVELQKIYF